MFCVSHKLALERERTWLLTNLCGKEKQADFFGKEAFFLERFRGHSKISTRM